MQSALTFLLILVIVVVGIGQIVAMIWIFRRFQQLRDREKERRQTRMIFRGVAVALVVTSAVTTIYSAAFIMTGERTTGSVVELREREPDKEDEDQSPLFTSVFAFTNSAGKRFEVIPTWASRPAGFKVGDVVPVIYTKGQEDWARIDSFAHHWGLPILFGIFSLFFLVVAEWSFFWAKIISKFVEI